MKIARRDRLKIYGDLLSVLLDAQIRSEKIGLTKIQRRVNVPFDRLKGYVSELSDLGLIERKSDLIITEKGKKYLSEYREFLDFMKRWGLSYQKDENT